MSLRTTQVGLLKSGLKSLNGSINRYCTKPTNYEESVVISVSGTTQRRQNEIFGNDPRLPFHGQIGLVPELLRTKKTSQKSSRSEEPSTSDGFLRYRLSELSQVLEHRMRVTAVPDGYFQPEAPTKLEALQTNRELELKATPCPKTFKTDLKNLFLDGEIDQSKVTVLNLTQKSENDMSAWSQEMEAEREELTKNFIEVASAIVSDLKKLGGGKYWADFIDPASGRPYCGSFTNATLSETDERYRELGFKIEDLGCCKVIKHVAWGPKAFVGTIFTDAPLDSKEVQDIVNYSKAGQYFQNKPVEE